MRTLLSYLSAGTFVLLLSFFTSSFAQTNVPIKKLNEKEVNVLIDSLERKLKRHYIFPDKVALMMNAVRKIEKSGVYNRAGNAVALSAMLQGTVQHAHPDKHLRIQFDPQEAERLERVPTASEQKEEEEWWLKEARSSNFAFKRAEIFPGNIGYVRWDEFYPVSEEAKSTIKGAFQFIQNSEALIIDMRYNGGGSPEMVLEIQNYFFAEQTRMNDLIDKNNDTLKHLTNPTKAGVQLRMPVYILTGDLTFSAAEDFTYALQQSKRAVVVGHTTGGGAHHEKRFSLGQGFVMDIPYMRSYNIYTKTDWEGKGLQPDVMVTTGEDALAKAQFRLLTDRMLKARNERERNAAQWNLNNLLSKTQQMPASEKLLPFCGSYEGLSFQVKDNHFFCKNAELGNHEFELSYIGNDTFVLDENVQVKFEKNPAGLYFIKLLWKSGNITTKARNAQ